MNKVKGLALFSLIIFVGLTGCAKKPLGEDPLTSMNPPEPYESVTAELNPVEEIPVQEAVEPLWVKTASFNKAELKTIYFGYDSHVLTEEARQVLVDNASWLIANEEINITIEGHCDERGSDEYNLALGESRALAVKNYLVTLGIAPDRLTTISFGEERPAAAGHSESVWAKNRRSEFN